MAGSRSMADQEQEDAWVVGVGDRVIRMVGATEESVRSMLREAICHLVDSARITIRPMTDFEREAEMEADESGEPGTVQGHPNGGSPEK